MTTARSRTGIPTWGPVVVATVAGSLTTPLGYPLRGEAGERPLVACWVLLLLAGLVPVVPLVPLLGYLILVLAASARGESAPPLLDDGRRVLQRGLGGTALVVLFLGGPIAVLLITVYGASFGAREAAPSGTGVLVFYAGSTAVLFAALLAAYLLPIALLRYAGTGRLRGGLDVGALRTAATSAAYFRDWVAGAVATTTAATVASRLAALGRLGAVVAALVLAYALLVTAHLWGRSLAGVWESARTEPEPRSNDPDPGAIDRAPRSEDADPRSDARRSPRDDR